MSRIAALTVTALLPLGGKAHGATGLVEEEPLFTGGTPAFPVVDMAPNGYAIAGWVQGTTTVHVSLRPPGGPWTAPQILGEDGTNKQSLDLAIN